MKVVTLQEIPHVPAEGGEPIEGVDGAGFPITSDDHSARRFR